MKKLKLVNYKRSFPRTYNFLDEYQECKAPVRVQGKCGSCWAFSSTLSLAYRFCKLTHQFIEFSPQYSVSCDTNNYGCDYGTFEETWNFFEEEGSISEKCFPYVSQDFGIPECPQICKDGTEMNKYKIKEMSKESFNGPIEFKSELINYGPLQVGIDLYMDILTYSGGVYRVSKGEYPLGSHAVVIIGWGEENESQYWIVQNSWGEKWGEKGFFRIAFGEAGIDSIGYGGIPKIN